MKLSQVGLYMYKDSALNVFRLIESMRCNLRIISFDVFYMLWASILLPSNYAPI